MPECSFVSSVPPHGGPALSKVGVDVLEDELALLALSNNGGEVCGHAKKLGKGSASLVTT